MDGRIQMNIIRDAKGGVIAFATETKASGIMKNSHVARNWKTQKKLVDVWTQVFTIFRHKYVEGMKRMKAKIEI